MKLWVLSDLWLDVAPLRERMAVPDADVCVVAGDVLDGGVMPSLRWLAENIGIHMPVLFVAGEREFFDSSWLSCMRVLSETRFHRGVHILDNGIVTIGEATFVGSTLWTDFAALGPGREAACMEYAAANVEYYHRVMLRGNPSGRLTPSDVRRRHFECRRFVRRALVDLKERTVVVITHHAPSLRSTEPYGRDDLSVATRVANLDDLIIETAPRLWVHGHTRQSVDYLLGQTRIVANIRHGTSPEVSSTFDPSFIVAL